MTVKDRVAIVTGGSRGIGEGISRLFVEHGAKVAIWDLLDEGQAVADELTAQGADVIFQNINITDRAAVEAGVAEVVERFGTVDILINNAGITKDKSFAKMTEEQWDAVMSVNLKGIFHCSQAVMPIMKEKRYGRIISASSTSGLRGNFGQANYAATKAGVVGMMKTLAVELGPHGITANAIAPGYVKTAMTDAIPDNIKQMALMTIPVGFLAEPKDLAVGYLFLASEESRFVNGVCLPIDGGFSR